MKTIVFDYYNTLYNPKTGRLFPAIPSLLRLLKIRYALVLITTCSPNRKSEIQKLGLNRFFQRIVICSKKTRKIFRRFIQKPEESLVIGDRLEEEIRIGSQLGARTLFVNSNTRLTLINIAKQFQEERC